MARLLIVTAWYYPFIHPRAHRWTSLAEHWAALGHDVHIVCARRRECPNEATLNGVRVHRTGFDSLKELFYFWLGGKKGRGRVGAGVQRPGRGIQLLSILYNAIWKKIYFPDDACIWYFPARRKVADLLRSKSFDALMTVSLPFTGHLIGLSAKRHCPEIHWLADIGDPFTIQAQPLNNAFLYGKRSRRLEKKVLEQADSLVVTHAAAVRAYRDVFGPVANKIKVVPPLLHHLNPGIENQILGRGVTHFSEQAPGFRPIRIGYFGALYAPVRTPDVFLKLLENTFLARPDLKKRMSIHFFGDVFPEFYTKIKHAEVIRLHGLQSRQTVRAAMEQMDILLNIGNTTEFQLPSKVVDYLASGKPVLHLSYVDQDPFVDFWGNAPGLFVVPVSASGLKSNSISAWIDFLENPPACATEKDLKSRLFPFTIHAVANNYAALIPGLEPTRLSPAAGEAPVHR